MMRRIDRELDLPSHVAKRIKEKFEKLRREKEESDRIIQGLQDSVTKMREYLDKLRTGEIPSIEDRLTALEKQHEIIDHQTLKDSLDTLSDAILQLNQKIEKIEEFLKEKLGYE